MVAPGVRIDEDIAARVAAIAAEEYPEASLYFHPQCFSAAGHFAGPDAERLAALTDIANDPAFDAVWFARGGYGACRIVEDAIAALSHAARQKLYMGYSDAGVLLSGLYARGFSGLMHGPMPVDIIRPGGEAAVRRALAYLTRRDPAALDATVTPALKTAAYNMSILSIVLGTPLQPDLTDHVLMLEDVGEYMYRLDRLMFHITSNPGVRRAAGVRLGRCLPIPANETDFGMTEDDIARHWCARAGLAYLGRCDIGHDIDNKIAPFGRAP
ncbi:MAG: LD-carboxypeptidase [Hyphomonadaceae bacterium]